MTQPKYMGGMGFRDIEIFNLALLARQAWRILDDPNSLSARILKAAYFPTCGFLEAELGNRPLQICRAVIDGRDVLRQGLIRRVGDGSIIRIWETNWIPREGPMRPIVAISDIPLVFVSELMDATTTTWREELIRENFIPFDVDAIMSIPLCTRVIDDFWAWEAERSGRFTVKSCYRMVMNKKIHRENWIEEHAGASDFTARGKAWNDLWHIKVPTKLRVFLWRLAQHSMPSMDVLHHRNMSTTHLCALRLC